MANETDEQLMLNFGDGDISAFNTLVGRYKKYLLNLAYGFIPDRHQAEDIAQEAFLRVYKNAKKYTVQAKFSTWLTRIAINLCYDELRKRKKMRVVPLGNTDDKKEMVKTLPDPALKPEEVYANKQIAADINRALEHIPKEHRIVIIMAFYHKKPYEEIAGLLNLSISAVKMRINRGRMYLKDILTKKTV